MNGRLLLLVWVRRVPDDRALRRCHRPGPLEAGVEVAAIAERLVLGVAAPAEGGSREALEPAVASADHQVAPHGQRTVLHRGHDRDLAGLLVGLPVQPAIQQGAGRTTL